MLNRIAILMLVSVSLISAKTYTFTLSDTVQAGTVQLKPGEYRLKMDGSQIVLMDQTRHQIDITARLETSDHKFSQTSIKTSNEDGKARIMSIELGHTTSTVVFE